MDDFPHNYVISYVNDNHHTFKRDGGDSIDEGVDESSVLFHSLGTRHESTETSDVVELEGGEKGR